MLQSLRIKDFAIIDDLEVEFKPGLNVMTGETGAGKTIVVEALKLILGSRASSDAIRAGSEKAAVTAVFDAGDIPAALKEALGAAGTECEDGLIVHRVVEGQGRGRITLNGLAVTGSQLKSIAARLVDVSSQHEHQRLLDPSCHCGLVDEFGGLGSLVSSYRDVHSRWAFASRELKALEENERDAKGKLDFLKFELGELKAVDLKPGEDAALEAERTRLKNAGAIEERMRAAEELLYGGEGSAVEMADRAARLVSQCMQFDPDVGRWLDPIGRARAEIEESARGLRDYVEKLGSDPGRLEQIDERIHLIRGLLRKHGGTIASCMERKERIAAEMDAVIRYDEVVAQKSARLDDLARERREIAGSLIGARKRAAAGLGKAIAEELKGLGMGKVRFMAAIERRPEALWDDGGPDSIEFLISPNAGEPLLPLARIASGGELSRMLLAIKGALAGKARLSQTSVFDEVDAGIGGAVAEVVGLKLKEVARGRQVICITHLPQVAACGAHHIKIFKRVEAGRTVARLKALSGQKRTQEIARMLGGAKMTRATIAHAKEMLEGAAR